MNSKTSEDKAFPFLDFEPKWQKKWEDACAFRAKDPGEPGFDSKKKKYYILDMFPYPSGAGLHVGHPEGYTATDILARFRRMQGWNVLHPMGWDAFGLPAEQYAIQTGTHPKITTEKNINNFRKQIKRLGFSYDWSREINTTDVDYYKWTQWIFLKLYEKGLAYEAEIPVWWCEELGCVLANEEVIDGKSERGGYPVVRRPMRQWMLKITAYADRLLDDLELLDWPDSIKEMQRNWIGKSIGAEVDFILDNGRAKGEVLKVFTTRPDTLFGATYMVVSPEHPLLDKITDSKEKEKVQAYQKAASQKSELERTDLAKDKTGVFTGGYALNPVNNQRIPIWTSDYVLATYGTGAIMAVPAHDTRDFEFATTFHLPIIQVVAPKSGPSNKEEAYAGEGVNIHSGFLDGLDTATAKNKVIEWLEAQKKGKKAIHYKLRDWLFSRQRYWGEPIPVIHKGKGETEPLRESELPLQLPEMDDFKPTKTAEPPLNKATDWVNVAGRGLRETNTMPQWAGSCWYYLRYIDPKNSKVFVDPNKEKYWMNVDLYVGGAEHAVLHLLYSRFWHKVLFDLKLISTPEPFQKLVNQGIILGEDGQKMSKSRGNVVNPDEVIDEYGADSMRLFEMFMGPLEQSKAWSTQGLQGVYRFLGRVWRLVIDPQTHGLHPSIVQQEPTEVEMRQLHILIQKVTQDLEKMQFNTAISAFMIFVNEMYKLNVKSQPVIENFIKLLSPFASHMAEELWEKCGKTTLVCQESWPSFDPKWVVQETIEIPVQINGKIKARVQIPQDLSEEAIQSWVMNVNEIKSIVQNKTLKKVIIVPKRLVNIVME